VLSWADVAGYAAGAVPQGVVFVLVSRGAAGERAMIRPGGMPNAASARTAGPPAGITICTASALNCGLNWWQSSGLPVPLSSPESHCSRSLIHLTLSVRTNSGPLTLLEHGVHTRTLLGFVATGPTRGILCRTCRASPLARPATSTAALPTDNA
jgi:hypothetical protein